MKVLIVEDDLPLSDVLAFTLRRAGYDPVIAHDGLTALEMWRAEQPDFILLDLNLPQVDGLVVCRRVRSEWATPIIILCRFISKRYPVSGMVSSPIPLNLTGTALLPSLPCYPAKTGMLRLSGV